MPLKMEKFLQIAPHSLAIVLGPAEGSAGEKSRAAQPAPSTPARQLTRHHIGYEIFADFKAENMQHFWNKKVTAAVAETFFLGWIDEQVLLIQGKEEHLEVLREGWTRRALRPPSGFHIRCLGESGRRGTPVPRGARGRHRRGDGPLPRVLRASLHLRAAAGGGAGGPLRARDPGTSWHLKWGFVPFPTRLPAGHRSLLDAGGAPWRGGAGGWPGRRRRRRRRGRLGGFAAASGSASLIFCAVLGPGQCVRAGEKSKERIQVASGGNGLYRGKRRQLAVQVLGRPRTSFPGRTRPALWCLVEF